ncbi:MAG: hypothetical protein QOC87_2221 [Actinomycetota bacterium]|nr:hypothetical protein [Actinomycetota bacterium]
MVNLTLEDMGALYRETRTRIGEIVLAAAGEGAGPVPACPGWTIKDVVAHLTGVCEDILSGNIADAPSEPWTAAQVDRVRDVPLADLVARWGEAAAQVEPLTPMFPDRTANQWVADITSHEHDLRGALDVAGARDSAGVEVAVDFLALSFLAEAKARSLPALSIVTEQKTWSTKDAGPAARLSGSSFELMRALSGRRSIDQISALDWDGEAEAFSPAFEWGPFHPRDEALIE